MVRGTERALRDTSRCSEGAVARAARPQRRYGETIPMRLSPDLKGEVDAWADNQPDKPSRSEALRRLVKLALAVKARQRRF